MTELIIGEGGPNYFTVTLQKLGTTPLRWTFDKEAFRNICPNSLLSQALELDPKVTNIDIDKSCVTPTVMSILWIIVNKHSHVHTYVDQLKNLTSEMCTNFIEASRYFLIDELAIFGHPGIVEMLNYNSYDNILHNPSFFMIQKALLLGHNTYIYHLWEQLDGSTQEDVFIGSIVLHNMELMKKLIKKVDPDTAKNHLMTYSKDKMDIDQDYTRIYYNSLVSSGMLSDDVKLSHSLYYACCAGYIDTIEFLLKNTSIEDHKGFCLILSLEDQRMDIIELLVTHRKYDSKTKANIISRIGSKYLDESVGKYIKPLMDILYDENGIGVLSCIYKDIRTLKDIDSELERAVNESFDLIDPITQEPISSEMLSDMLVGKIKTFQKMLWSDPYQSIMIAFKEDN